MLSMNEVTTYRWSFEEDVANYVAAGWPAIGVWRQKLSDFGEQRGIELLAESGLAVSNLLWAGGFTGSDGRSFRESVDDALEAVRLAAEMHAGCLVVYSGGRSGHTHNHARRLVRDGLREVMRLAETLNVLVALEPMHAGCAADWTFLTTLDDTLALIEATEHPQLRLAFDTYHLGQDPKIVERVPELVKLVAVVHVADALEPPEREQNRRRLGQGKLPLEQIIRAFAAAGYQGSYDVELIGEDIEAANYAEILSQSKCTLERWLE